MKNNLYQQMHWKYLFIRVMELTDIQDGHNRKKVK